MRRLLMGIFHFFNKKKPLLFRCTECYYEFELSIREVRLLEIKNCHDPVCPPREICHICHTGFMIPVNYSNKSGKQYLFNEIKPKIKKLDPDKVFENIFENPESEFIMFFPPEL